MIVVIRATRVEMDGGLEVLAKGVQVVTYVPYSLSRRGWCGYYYDICDLIGLMTWYGILIFPTGVDGVFWPRQRDTLIESDFEAFTNAYSSLNKVNQCM